MCKDNSLGDGLTRFAIEWDQFEEAREAQEQQKEEEGDGDGGDSCKIPYAIPPNASIKANIAQIKTIAAIARNVATTLSVPLGTIVGEGHIAGYFAAQVGPYGPWDYKSHYGPKYADFGNFNYGATGRAAGYSRETLARMAGAVQVTAGMLRGSGSGPGNPITGSYVEGQQPALGDHINDWAPIKSGMDYHDKGCHEGSSGK